MIRAISAAGRVCGWVFEVGGGGLWGASEEACLVGL